MNCFVATRKDGVRRLREEGARRQLTWQSMKTQQTVWIAALWLAKTDRNGRHGLPVCHACACRVDMFRATREEKMNNR
ncbi:hypothetical protein A2592_02800 [Candidatus Kaiserbacteria bacterium RIFOXYD1_FULL_42_15]|uniref:Uncharacterized protein n=1 Tax=Candidatus Kaiserbacteria bacterium RIFOXYD1_FULL_42_15 TaxID=1798532 RepID=A0A1F6FU39_9BACT|nr:MAG: hypothetical protein A2592_02800 [Candidatus Kaiserbacteria bacterium RIFOXYD1_FULL_42_15]